MYLSHLNHGGSLVVLRLDGYQQQYITLPC